ncbi:signal recognition particle-docking protein FtsY [Vitiosangium sp. GDMCC 1.1324]|uniref:signal recognition particle-docking protein FtsY n=1 Tax=Vitiosangium sp. (strain GDMCC 1.1324) TaxID=2138576 RepID=UPI000D3C52D1|nr:signal recognition particle-docking protein FtsY [Vitiosangium sp. GDMCC 1.1324]PTL78628.1 signal recognition particle-docking protein FtsY [Vitiosangium sp. GDMCC 1.1324]
MKTPTALPFVLAQAPSPQPSPLPQEPPQTQPGVPETGTPPPPEGSPVGTVVGVGVTVLLVALMVAAARKLFFKRRPEVPGKAPTVPPTKEKPELPAERPELRVELPPTEAELARRREAEELHARAEALTRQREEATRAAKATTDAAERARLEAEARTLKEREEEEKRAEYRAKKAAEDEAKERRKREREEAERQLAEQKAREAAAAEEARRAEEAAARAKIEAEAGRTLAQGLDKTRSQGFMARLNGLFGSSRKVDESVLAEMEEILFTADIGVRTASNLVEVAREKLKRNELSDANRIKDLIREEVTRIVDLPVPRTMEGGGPPHVVMVVGVNGAGKTTTIGKLAAKLTGQGKKVVLAAGDTFRAAATEQLDVWADRAKAELVKGPEGADPSSVIFEAIKKAQAGGANVVIADTAGRLHTKVSLMEELKKVKRVIDKALPGAPHEVLLVLDSTNGQNAIQQARQFHEAVGVTAIALTKLDGTAKGGVIIGISDELKIPVVWAGVGEKVADLRRFDAREFVQALFD